MNLLPMIPEQNRFIMCPHPFTMERTCGFVAHGLTIREILDVKGIDISQGASARVLVEDLVIPEMLWDVYRPHVGALIIIRAVPMGSGDAKSVQRAIMMIAIVALSMYVAGPALANMMFGAGATPFQIYATGVGVAMISSMLLNALVPPPMQKLDERTGLDLTRSPSLSGASNRINKYGPIPKILGIHKVIPPFAMEPYTSFTGNDQYLHLLFCIGYGPLLIEDLKIGDTDLTEFKDVYYEVRNGFDDDDALDITNTVHEESLSILLKYSDGYHIRTTSENVDEFSVDIVCPTGMFTLTDKGKKEYREVYFQIQYAPTGTSNWSVGDTFEAIAAQESPSMYAPQGFNHPDPTLKASRLDIVALHTSTGVAKVFYGPTGITTVGSMSGLALPNVPFEYAPIARVLMQEDDTTVLDARITDVRDDKLYSQNDSDFAPSETSPASLKIDIAAGDLRTNYRMRGRSASTLRKTFHFVVDNGQYDVRIKRVTADAATDTIYDEAYWTTIRSIFYEDPVLLSNIATIFLKIKATEQLNGVIQNFSCVASSIINDWTGAAWSDRISNNPASIYREILQGLGNNRAIADSRIDITALQTWHDNCETNGFTYNQPIDFRSSIEDMLREVAAAGRAAPAYLDGQFSIVEDKEQTTPIQHFSPRNSWDFSSTKRFMDMPHGFRCLFPNEDKDYAEDERVVYDDDYDVDNATELEMLQLTGVTDADLIWKHGRYHIAAARLRPETYSWYVDVENIVCTRGDLIRVSHDVPLWGVAWGRVKAIQVDNGNTTGVTMDEEMSMEIGSVYCIRFRKADGTSVLRNVVSNPGTPVTIVFETAIATASGPAVGDLGLFGVQTLESIECIVKNIEPGPELSARIVAVDAAEAIYTSDTGTIPDFDSKITRPFDPFNALGVPIIDSIRSDETVLIRQIDGSLAPRILISFKYSDAFMFSYVDVIEVEYKSSDTDDPWERIEVPVTASEISLIHIEFDEEYDIRCRFRLNDKRVGMWAIRENYLVVGLSSLPPDVDWLMIHNSLLIWKYPIIPLDWAGFELRYHNGRLTQAWETAHKVQDGLITTTSYDVAAIGIYEKTFLLKAVDIAGNYSENAAIVITDLGDPIIENLMESTDYEALGFPGTITDGSVVGDDIIVNDTGGETIYDEDDDAIVDEADSIIIDETGGALLWADDDNPYWTGNNLDYLWVASYPILKYQFSFVPLLVDPDSGLAYSNPSMILEYLFEGVSPTIEYRLNGESLLWDEDSSTSLWSSDSNLLWSTIEGWNEWPSNLKNLKRQKYEFLITIQGSRIRSKIKELVVSVDVPDIEETVEDVNIAAIGTRLSLIETYIKIKVVNMTLQDDAGVAMSLVAIDKLRTGPLIEAYTEAGVNTTAVIDARIQGY